MRLPENERTVTGMAKYIEREALEVDLNHRLNFLMGENGEYDHYTSGFDEAVTRVENFPSADVAPVRHGQWETNSDRPDTLICSVCKCGFDMWKHDPHNFCPNCGAKMDEEVNE